LDSWHQRARHCCAVRPLMLLLMQLQEEPGQGAHEGAGQCWLLVGGEGSGGWGGGGWACAACAGA
jgi:hypothetical protein